MNFDHFCLLPDAKNYEKKSAIYTFKHLRSNSLSPVYLLRDLDIYFPFKIFEICIFRSFLYIVGCKSYEKKSPYTFNHLRSNVVRTVFRHRDLDKLFHGKNNKILIFRTHSMPTQTFDLTLNSWRFSSIFDL